MRLPSSAGTLPVNMLLGKGMTNTIRFKIQWDWSKCVVMSYEAAA